MKVRAKIISKENVEVSLEDFWRKYFGVFKNNLNVKFGRTDRS